MPIILSVTPNLEDNPWSDLKFEDITPLERVGALPKGTKEGNPTIYFQGTVEGKVVVFQTSLRNMVLAMRSFELLYGDLDVDDICTFYPNQEPQC